MRFTLGGLFRRRRTQVLGVVRGFLVNRKVQVVYRCALPVLIVCQTFLVELVLRPPHWWISATNTFMG